MDPVRDGSGLKKGSSLKHRKYLVKERNIFVKNGKRSRKEAFFEGKDSLTP